MFNNILLKGLFLYIVREREREYELAYSLLTLKNTYVFYTTV